MYIHLQAQNVIQNALFNIERQAIVLREQRKKTEDEQKEPREM